MEASADGPRRPRDLTLLNWDRPPYNRWSFQHVREIVPTAPIATGVPTALVSAERRIDPNAVAFTDHSGRPTTVGRLLDASFTDGVLILHKGKVAYESYRNGMRPATLHLAQSVSKSVIAALTGILHHGGALPLDRQVSDFVPEFCESAYRFATVEHLLDMTSGVDFPEDVLDPVSALGVMDIAVGWKPVSRDNPSSRSVRALIASLRKTVRPHGAQFEYRSMETEVLGTCIEAATGARLCDLISELIWQPMGAEHEANFGVDPEGYAIADGGLSASLRDLGRFGLLYAQNGCVNGRQIVPQAWIRETGLGDASRFPASRRADWPNGAYRYQFWIEDVAGSTILALGIYGQMIYIDHARDFVGVKLSSWPRAIDPAMRADACKAMSAMANVLN